MTALLAVQADPLGFLVAFGAGMLSFLSPCVLPLVPGYLSMVSGLTASELAAGGREGTAGDAAGEETPGAASDTRPARSHRSRLLAGLLGFVAGFTVVFTLLGAAASSVGHVLLTHQRLLDRISGGLVMAFGVLFVLLALGVRLPLAVVAERRVAVRPSLLGAWAPPVMGAAFAFGWTPCIGPVLGSVLGLAAARGTLYSGVGLLIAYSLGLGIPFLAAGLAFERVTRVIGTLRSRLRAIDLVGGLVLVAFGALLVTGDLGVVSGWFGDLLRFLHLSRLSTS